MKKYRDLLLESIPGLISVFLIFSVFRYMNYGFDFTDESFYMLWISRPWDYHESLSQFGYFFYPIYQLLHGDIFSLRLLNILNLLLLSFAVSFVFLNRFQKAQFSPWQISYLSFCLSTSSLAFLQFWLPFPNYNSLNFDSLLIAFMSYLLILNENLKQKYIGAFLLAIGLWMSFVAKPTTYGLMVIASLVFLVVANFKFKKRLFFIAVFSHMALILLTIFYIDGSISVFINRIQLGLDHMKILDSGYTPSDLLRWNSPFSSMKEFLAFAFFITAMGVAFFLRRTKWASTFMCLCMNAAAVTIFVQGLGRFVSMKESIFLGFVFVSVCLQTVVFKFEKNRNNHFHILVFFLYLLPCIYSFGSGNSFLFIATFTSYFWVLALLGVLSQFQVAKRSLFALSFVSVALFVTSVFVLKSLSLPYRQFESFEKMKAVVDVAESHSALVVSEDFKRYISEIQGLNSQGQYSNYNLLDLTGHSPGVAVIMKLRAPGKPWILGGYRGSDRFASEVIKNLSCVQVANSLILVEPTGPYKISESILESTGLSIKTDYRVLGELVAPIGEVPDHLKQLVYLPIDVKLMIEKCEKQRAISLGSVR